MGERQNSTQVITANQLKRIGGTAAQRLEALKREDLSGLNSKQLDQLTTAVLYGGDTPIVDKQADKLVYSTSTGKPDGVQFGIVANDGPDPFTGEINEFVAALSDGPRHAADPEASYEGHCDSDLAEYLGGFHVIRVA